MKSGDRCLPVYREWLASALPKRKREHASSDYAQHTIPGSDPTRIQRKRTAAPSSHPSSTGLNTDGLRRETSVSGET